MALLLRTIIDNYHYINEEVADPRTSDMFLIGSPWPILSIIGLYFYFVLTLGPRLMEGRKPFQLERIMQIYNIIQVVISIYSFYKFLVLLKDFDFRCEPIDYTYSTKALNLISVCYLYFITKIIDLADTVFFVLRKKQNQVSFLHVYHHGGMILGAWIGMKWLPGGHLTFIAFLNSFVHSVMYTYYLLTSYKMSQPWWKKHITQLQLLQFFLILIHASQLIWAECDYPKWPAALLLPQNLFMIVLFGDFYYKAYIKKPKNATNGVKKNGKNE